MITTPLGKIEAIKLIRHREQSKGRQTILWCAPALNYLPIKLEHTEKGGAVFTAVLRHLEGLILLMPLKRLSPLHLYLYPIKAMSITNKKFTIINETIQYKGFFSLKTIELKHTLDKGGWSKPITRELFHRGNCVAVLLYDPIRDEVVIIEQFSCWSATTTRRTSLVIRNRSRCN